ncbi:hypothetical protein PZ938_01395 [Luteipulveratus sp. YIM 133132]|uniref:hypothetical protein n=1 Tax=Luteipulveratus flavus TaxID=3031728 RepID=UPI0023AFCAE3|nr:hypothetical protein [Luteipulveratus sp. YIM 133132]MDE9364249.1 hypothetical protein [Luteipulveratus sp. YIM 133132]
MRSSSLIFLVIVIIWAAYLLQHWVRRRDYLATARSVDRFSEGIRVLERRPTAAHGTAEDEPVEHGTVLAAATASPSAQPRSGSAMTPDDQARPPARTAPAAAHPSDRGEPEGVQPRQVRAGALLATVAMFVLVVVLTPFGVTPWWSPLVMLVGLGGVVAWLRSAAVRSTATPARVEPQARPRPQRAPAPRSAAVEREVYDVSPPSEQVVASTATTSEDETVAAPLEPGAWQPVDVPPPTYTMKAKAERPEPAPAEQAEEQVFDGREAAAEPQAPAAAAPATQEPAGAAQVSYADMPVEDLPFDGLALDEELEDLPPVHRAG